MRDDFPAEASLTSITGAEDWLVCGWFTPDYYSLAAHFSANLAAQNVPFHLWPKPKSERGWNTWRKPSVVLETMDAYPGKTVVLMDVDCRIEGDLAPVAAIAGDVGLTMRARWTRLLWPPHRRITIKACSRVVVFRPTEGARRFAAEWARLCEGSHYEGDEAALAAAFLSGKTGSSFSYIDPRYSGLGAGDAVVTHKSAYAALKLHAPHGWLKALERRYFRNGRTRAKQAALSG